MECIPILALRRGHHNQCVRVRVSRLWHYRGGLGAGEVKDIHMVLVDGQGGSIYALVPRRLVAHFIDIIDETSVYELGFFEMSDRPRVMNPVENPVVMLFTEFTIVRPAPDYENVIPKWTFKLTPITKLPAAHDTPPRLVDVVGIVRSVSHIGTHGAPMRSVATHRRCVVLADTSGHEVKINLWGEAAFRFNAYAIEYLARDESAIAIFVGMTVHLREGTSELSGAAPCRWYMNADTPEVNILRAESQALSRTIEWLPSPPPVDLRMQINGHYPLRRLSTLLHHDFFQNQDAMFRCVVRVWRLTPGQRWWEVVCTRCSSMATPNGPTSAEPNGFTCSNIECACTAVALRYYLRLLGGDGTGEAEFRVVGRIARDLVGVPIQQLILSNYHGGVPIANLAVAATQIAHTPPELAAIANATYRFFVGVNSAHFNGEWASFNVLAVEERFRH